MGDIGIRVRDSVNGRSWEAHVWVAGKGFSDGKFDSALEAAQNYDRRAKGIWINPILNFRPDGSLNDERMRQARPGELQLLKKR